jgi:hypothetical protein
MSDQAATTPTDGDDPAEGSGPDDIHDPVDDESGLMGRLGVEDEVLAELARAEAQLHDPDAIDNPDVAGAQV